MKQLLRYFSVGLFSAGIIMLIVLYFTDTRDIEEYKAEELIPFIEEDGYHVLNNEEYISLTLNPNKDKEDKDNQEESDTTEKETNEEEVEDSAENVKENKDETEDKNEEKASEDEEKQEKTEKVTNYTINIEPGMVTSTISSLLEENSIIDDAREFNDYLDDNDYSLLVQIGKFELNSEMSFYEIAEAITR